MGYAVRSFLVAMSRQFILFIPLVFIFTSIWGVAGIWYTFMISDILAGLLSFVVYEYEMRDLKRKIPLIHQTVS
jgi:Na+-driven multidrug efflux pump